MPWPKGHIPTTWAALRERNRSIYRRHQAGTPTKDIARAWGLSPRQVRRVVQGMREGASEARSV